MVPVHESNLGLSTNQFLFLSAADVRRALPIEAAVEAMKAVMDGAVLTALRTGAASGATTDLLARPEAATAAILGAGVQARTQLEGI